MLDGEERTEKNLKLVLMGKSKAGKTSMESIIFSNLTPSETNHIGFTLDVNVGRFSFLGMTLMINDCAGYTYFYQSRETGPTVHPEPRALLYRNKDSDLRI